MEDLSSLCSDKQRDWVGVKMMLPLVTDRERQRDSTHALYSFYLPLLFIVRGPSCDSFLVHSEHVKGKAVVSEEIGDFTTNSTSGSLSMQSQLE